jgi:hypothetical protein
VSESASLLVLGGFLVVCAVGYVELRTAALSRQHRELETAIDDLEARVAELEALQGIKR